MAKSTKKPVKKRATRKKVLVIPNSTKVTWEEKKLVVPLLIKRIRKAQKQKQEITNVHLCHSLAKHHGIKIQAATVRKLLHYIRVNHLMRNLIATSKGYFISKDPIKLINYVKSLQKRIREIGDLKKAIQIQSKLIVNRHIKLTKTNRKTRKK